MPTQKFYCQGPWAVVDGFTDGLWINLEHKRTAVVIARAFAWKTNAVVVDISKAENYEPNLIDSDVVLDWSLSQQSRESHGLPSVVNLDLELQDYGAEKRHLINTRQACQLDTAMREEIFNQIVYFIQVLDRIYPYLAWDGKDLTADQTAFLQHMISCFSSELEIPSIQARLFDLAITQTKQYPAESLALLTFLDRLYD